MSWRDLVRGVFFRVAAEAWVETDSVGRHQWGWRLRKPGGPGDQEPERAAR